MLPSNSMGMDFSPIIVFILIAILKNVLFGSRIF
jgi:uncharacterized protein YggT (Ycf19 family)